MYLCAVIEVVVVVDVVVVAAQQSTLQRINSRKWLK